MSSICDGCVYAVLYLEISSRGGKIKVSRNKEGQAQLDIKFSK